MRYVPTTRRVGFVFHQQVLADGIETVHIETRIVRTLQSLAQLDIEDLEAQTACGLAIYCRFREPQADNRPTSA